MLPTSCRSGSRHGKSPSRRVTRLDSSASSTAVVCSSSFVSQSSASAPQRPIGIRIRWFRSCVKLLGHYLHSHRHSSPCRDRFLCLTLLSTRMRFAFPVAATGLNICVRTLTVSNKSTTFFSKKSLRLCHSPKRRLKTKYNDTA